MGIKKARDLINNGNYGTDFPGHVVKVPVKCILACKLDSCLDSIEQLALGVKSGQCDKEVLVVMAMRCIADYFDCEKYSIMDVYKTDNTNKSEINSYEEKNREIYNELNNIRNMYRHPDPLKTYEIDIFKSILNLCDLRGKHYNNALDSKLLLKLTTLITEISKMYDPTIYKSNLDILRRKIHIDQSDLDSGKVVQNHCGTFYFKEPGNNTYKDGFPIEENLHRDDDEPAWADKRGNRRWYKDGKLHRDNGPAFITEGGGRHYYKHGKLHRLDGPAGINLGI